MNGGRDGGEWPARLCEAAVPNSLPAPTIDGWTVTRQGVQLLAVCDSDPSLVVEHRDPAFLAEVCAAITRPPRRVTRLSGPLGGLNV